MLTDSPRVKEQMVWFRSGHFYNFHYSNYGNDPIPTIIMLNYIHGTHPNTGHIHNYIQAINLTYIPRNYRKKFVDLWMPILRENRGNVRLTWNRVQKTYPWIKYAVRRYLVRRNFIKYPREIPFDDVEREVVSTWIRDYSMLAMKQLAIINDRMRGRNQENRQNNRFAKSLSKYLYRYQGRG